MKLLIMITLSALSLTLGGCHSSNNNSNGIADPSNMGDTNIPGETNNTGSQLKAIASQVADSEPDVLADVATLQNDIKSLFNNPDSAPVTVESGDSIQDVINRAGSF